MSGKVKILEQEPLREWTFWKIGGPADFFALPKNIDDLKQAAQFAKEKNLAVTVLGGGTNVLVSDKGIRGLVICLQEFIGVEAQEKNGRLEIVATAGTPKSELTKIFVKNKLAPALFLCGLPGDVGGGVVMNAGVSEKIIPREFVEITDWFEVLDQGKIKRFEKKDVQWHYRHSEGWQPGIVVRAQVSWPMETDAEIGKKVKDATKNRLAKQPLNLPSCGSTFKNPTGHSAGALIDQSGLKGFRIGGAEVSTKHANFIVNVGQASAADVHAIIQHVQETVRGKFQVSLETEVRYLGDWG
jgi:UDP-N-acetylmuramate dehydrogenase